MMPHTLGNLDMTDTTTENQTLEATPVHLSEILLDREFNPAGDPILSRATPNQLLEACGLIPHFFCEACAQNEVEGPDGAGFTLDNIADAMDRIYQYGGFSYGWKGTVDQKGIYHAPDAEDPPLSPIMRFRYRTAAAEFCDELESLIPVQPRVIECMVYRYAIVAIRERNDGPVRIGRFD